jgi:hypothetical protein
MIHSTKVSSEELITCKNCGTAFKGNYCNECGQKSDTERLNLKYLLHNLFHATTHMDAGYFYTIRELAFRPGHFIREYLQGKRSSHGDPVVMLLIIGGLCSVLYNHYHLKTLSSVDISTFKGDMQMFSLKFFAFAFLGYSILFSLSDFIFFRYKEYNYIELFVMNLFTCIGILFLFILLVPFWIFFKDTEIFVYLRLLVIFSVLSYQVFVRYQFFEVSADKKAKHRIYMDTLVIIVVLVVAGWKTWQNLFL